MTTALRAQRAAGPRATAPGPAEFTGAAGLLPGQARLGAALPLAGTAGVTGEPLRGMPGAGPGQPRPPASLRQMITRPRRRPGPAPGRGEHTVCRARSVYAPDRPAALDGEEPGVRAARGRGPLRAAPGLVRGQPPAGRYYQWLESVFTGTVQAAVTAPRLAAGDPAAARDAARAGLAAGDGAGQLPRLLIRAGDPGGSTAGVNAARRGALTAAAITPRPGAAALYRDGAGRRPAQPAAARPAAPLHPAGAGGSRAGGR